MNDTNLPEDSWKPTREMLIDTMGRPRTQSIILEIDYSDFAIYTLKDEDYEYNGKLMKSLKALYLAMEDVTEYEFATTYFANWRHWERICENKLTKPSVLMWRHELELKLRARAAKQMAREAAKGSIQALKWIADKGWEGKSVGRPSKEHIEKEANVQSIIRSEYEQDHLRLVGTK